MKTIIKNLLNPTLHSQKTDLGILLLRLTAGGLMLNHGIPKIDKLMSGTFTFPDPLGIGTYQSLLSAIGTEVFCSILIILGIGTRLSVVPSAFTMAVAFFLVHANDPFQKKELALIFLILYVVLFFTGGGKYSADALLWKMFGEKKPLSGH